MQNVFLIQPESRNDAYQFFMEWFSEAWGQTGGSVLPNLGLPWHLRLLAAKGRLVRPLIKYKSDSKKLLVLCAGYPDSFIWPYSYTTEVIPFIWDCWPRYWPRLLSSLRRHNVRLVFITSSQVVRLVQQSLPDTRVVWIPEGIKTDIYQSGKPLDKRSVDVVQLGRRLQKYHEAIIVALPRRKMLWQRDGESLLFPSLSALTDGLADTKITVCFPRKDTHPEHAGSVETLTQRYWECMLSRTVMIGRAPDELKELIGYDPVINVDWSDPGGQVENILNNIDSYQALVDENRETALSHGDWRYRMKTIRENLTATLNPS